MEILYLPAQKQIPGIALNYVSCSTLNNFYFQQTVEKTDDYKFKK